MLDKWLSSAVPCFYDNVDLWLASVVGPARPLEVQLEAWANQQALLDRLLVSFQAFFLLIFERRSL